MRASFKDDKDFHSSLEEYIKSAYAYEITYEEENITMSDYEWDMMGLRLKEHWDAHESPLKAYCDREDLGTTAGGGAINFRLLREVGLI